MTRVIPLDRILAALPGIDLVPAIAEGFVALSEGRVEVPPVGELLFPEAHGEMHVKYGAVRGDTVFVVKIATGFFGNPQLGLPPFGGCMIVLSQITGMVEAVLLEEGELTNHRTAAAGAVAAQALAPADPGAIGILGSGTQARLQADYLRRVTKCRSVHLWGRDAGSAARAANDIGAMGYHVTVAQSPAAVADACRLIVTTTPAETPLLTAAMVRPGTHITAMGSDTPEKCEVDPALLARADAVVADSRAQAGTRGEIFQAMKAGVLTLDRVVELGEVLSGRAPGRTGASDITVADLTGVAIQDIVIAKAVLEGLKER
jgi:ornithine cyclodeaminase